MNIRGLRGKKTIMLISGLALIAIIAGSVALAIQAQQIARERAMVRKIEREKREILEEGLREEKQRTQEKEEEIARLELEAQFEGEMEVTEEEQEQEQDKSESYEEKLSRNELEQQFYEDLKECYMWACGVEPNIENYKWALSKYGGDLVLSVFERDELKKNLRARPEVQERFPGITESMSIDEYKQYRARADEIYLRYEGRPATDEEVSMLIRGQVPPIGKIPAKPTDLP